MHSGWMAEAACRGKPLAWFITPDDQPEPWQPDPRALALCDRCPVRQACLDRALEDGEVGTWGGTTSHQRRQLHRRRARLACPVCGSRQIVEASGRRRVWHPARTQPAGGRTLEVCLACATSWPAA
jgi:WhiB family transcriptional regulator, redox-sensing transcriptional regulator